MHQSSQVFINVDQMWRNENNLLWRHHAAHAFVESIQIFIKIQFLIKTLVWWVYLPDSIQAVSAGAAGVSAQFMETISIIEIILRELFSPVPDVFQPSFVVWFCLAGWIILNGITKRFSSSQFMFFLSWISFCGWLFFSFGSLKRQSVPHIFYLLLHRCCCRR